MPSLASLYKQFVGGYKHFSQKNQALDVWAETPSNTPEKEKKVVSASEITISLNLYLLKACNRDSRVTSLVRNSYTLLHNLAMSFFFARDIAAWHQATDYICTEYLASHMSFKPS